MMIEVIRECSDKLCPTRKGSSASGSALAVS